jgi:hypothetical protein
MAKGSEFKLVVAGRIEGIHLHTFDFFSKEWLVGIVFSVHRRYLLDSFANSDGVTAAFEGRLMGGGGL